jgi:bifunctional non-homologous end joining protein LigD
VKWDEVEQVLKKKDATLLVFEAGQVLDRVGKMGDLFEPVLKLKQKLPKLAGIAEAVPRAAEPGLDRAAQAEDPGTKKAKKKNTKPARRRSVSKPKGRKV